MIRIRATLLAGGLMLALSASPVLASGATATPFKVSYSPLPGITTNCAGLHTVTRTQIRDNEVCLVKDTTGSLAAGTFSASDYFGWWPPFITPDVGTLWFSDFDGAVASSWRVVVVDLGHGRFVWFIRANYPLA
jgi:hypothetical protein